MRILRWAGLAGGLLLGMLLPPAAPSPRPPAQGQQELFKPLQYEVSVALKLITVYVTDKNGKPVENLTLDDFTVSDNGQPMKLTEFEKHVLQAPPEEAAPAKPAAETAATPAPAPAATPPAPATTRKFFLFFDFAFNNARGITKARTAAQHFLETQVRPDDEVGVMTYSMLKGITVHEYLTRDHAKVREVVDAIGSKDIAGRAHEIEQEYWLMAQEPANPDARIAGAQESNRESSRDEGMRIAHTFILKLTAMAKALRYVQGNKHFVLFSTGIPTSLVYGNQVGSPAGGRLRFDAGDRVLRTANEAMYQEFAAANCVFYAFDTRESALVADLFAYDRMTFESGGRGAGRGMFGSQGVFQDSTSVFQDDKTTGGNTLRRLTDQTSGKYFSNINMYERNLDQVQALTGTYYVLGYSVGESEDGRFHEVKVEVKRKDCQVRAQSGYFSPKPFREFTDLEKRLHLFELALNERSFSRLPVSFPITGLSFAAAEGSGLEILAKVPADVTARFTGDRVEYVVLVFDDKNDIRDIRRLEADPRPHRGRPVVFTSAASLGPGDYTCRLVIRDLESGLSAASSVRATVPAAPARGLRLGTPLLLRDGTGCAFLETGPAKAPAVALPWSEIYPFDRTALSPVSGQVSGLTPRLLAVIPYSVPEAGEPDVVLSARLIDAASGEAVPVAPVLTGSSRYGTVETVVLEIPLPKLKPGKYFIYINAQDRASRTNAHSQTALVVK
jgi:VWFA-related protein